MFYLHKGAIAQVAEPLESFEVRRLQIQFLDAEGWKNDLIDVLGLRVWGLRFRLYCLGFRVWGLGFIVGFRVAVNSKY